MRRDDRREEIKDELLAALYGGGIEEALFDLCSVDDADEEELEEMADYWGI